MNPIITACTTPLDEPQSWEKNRGREYFWPLRRVEDDLGAYGPGWAGVQLDCWHFSNSKTFRTSLYPTTVFDNGMTSTEMLGLATAPWIKGKAVDRYSAKGLAAFATEALAEFRAAFTGGHEGIRALFEVTD